MACKPQDVVQQRRTNKWHNRWLRGVWLGKSENSDEHLVYDGNVVSVHRSVVSSP